MNIFFEQVQMPLCKRNFNFGLVNILTGDNSSGKSFLLHKICDEYCIMEDKKIFINKNYSYNQLFIYDIIYNNSDKIIGKIPDIVTQIKYDENGILQILLENQDSFISFDRLSDSIKFIIFITALLIENKIKWLFLDDFNFFKSLLYEKIYTSIIGYD